MVPWHGGGVMQRRYTYLIYPEQSMAIAFLTVVNNPAEMLNVQPYPESYRLIALCTLGSHTALWSGGS